MFAALDLNLVLPKKRGAVDEMRKKIIRISVYAQYYETIIRISTNYGPKTKRLGERKMFTNFKLNERAYILYV